MHRFIDGEDRMQQTLLPHCPEDYVGEENPVRVIEVFIDELDLAALGFSGMTRIPVTGAPLFVRSRDRSRVVKGLPEITLPSSLTGDPPVRLILL
jgi:hypothetical protein